ncbi:MAG: succinylglutamate desuccinylase/aspartoacylase family protein [Alphaproteobacteria bacterium]
MPACIAELADGQRAEYALSAYIGGDGAPLTVPVQVIAGHGPSPVTLLIAGVHGDEPEGPRALHHLWRTLDPARVRGRLVLVPVAHPPAFLANQRLSPLDGKDMNRSFPGDPAGSPTQRIAHALWHQVVSQAQFVFSMHSWSRHGETLPYVEVPGAGAPTAATCWSMADGAGFARVRLVDWPAGLLVKCANGAGIPAIEAEIGGGGVSQAGFQTLYRARLAGLLHHLEMIAAAPPPREGPAAAFTARHIPAPAGGLLDCAVELGDPVSAGQTLATLRQPNGAPITTITAPLAGTVAVRWRWATVQPGDIAFTLFQPATAPVSQPTE